MRAIDGKRKWAETRPPPKLICSAHMRKGFTLIELLVVIAIIGLLASVVLVSMSGLQGKAKITKTLEFSQSLQRNLGAYAVGVWSFDDQTNPTKDGSGYNNNGTINGAVFTPDTPHAAIDRGTGKYALSFDGVNDYVDAGNGASLNITQAITIEVWTKISDPAYYANIVGKGWDSQYELVLNPTGTTISFCLHTGSWSCSGTQFGGIPLEEWVHFAFTYDAAGGSGNMKGYMNGVLKATGTRTGSISATTAKLYIGSVAGSARLFNGLIDEVRIYEKALTLGEIQKRYADGLEEHRDLVAR